VTKIASLTARQILDSRGNPTVEAEIGLDDGTTARASVPSGASTGRHEARELRDADPDHYAGKGVQKAVANIDDRIAPKLIGARVEQARVDRTLIELDGTEDKSSLGANAILAVSLVTARAASKSAGIELWQQLAGDRTPALPLPMVNIFSGGLHARRQIEFQDFLVMPVGARTYTEALEMCVAIYRASSTVLTNAGYSTLKADEGGFGPTVGSHREALSLLQEAVTVAGLTPGSDVVYALDVAATHFFDPDRGTYHLRSEGRDCTAEELSQLISDLADEFPIASIEDALAEDDWQGWVTLTAQLGDRLQILGDDFFTTDPQRVKRGIELGAANAVLVKMNQIGTITETLEVVDIARSAGYRAVISARSGETEDPALADLTVASGAGQIKVGSVAQSERLAKYNQLLRIEEAFGSTLSFGPVDPISAPAKANQAR
jgi:enolase